MNRKTSVSRKTKETDIELRLNIDGKGKAKIKTGIGFLDHMLELFTYHGLFDIEIDVRRQDLDVDIHHTNEDIGIVLGEAFKKALKNKKGINRFGQSFIPMDEALARARVVLDISGRPSLYFNNRAKGLMKKSGEYDLNDCKQFLHAFVIKSGINMHVDIIRAGDMHHALESVFKALARALSEAASIEPRRQNKIPSTKGKL